MRNCFHGSGKPMISQRQSEMRVFRLVIREVRPYVEMPEMRPEFQP